MISTLDELLDDVFYDWGMTPAPQIRKSNLPVGFIINKTYIFERDGEYFLNYKTDEAPIEAEIFQQFSKLYDAFMADPQVADQLEQFAEEWSNSKLALNPTFKKFLKQFE